MNIPNLLSLAFSHLEAGRTQEAVHICQSILRQQPDHADTLTFLGVALYQTGNHAAAIDLLERAIRIDRNIPHYYNNCGEAYRAIHAYEAAVECYAKAIAINPDYSEAHNNFGNALQETGRLDEAIASYQRALAINPEYAEAHNNLAAVFLGQGNIDDAIAHFENAVVLKPNYANARRHLVMLRPRQGHVPIIRKLLENRSIPDEDAMHLHFALGKLCDASQDYEDAFENYRKGNQLKRKTVSFDSKAHSEYVDKLISTFSKQYFEERIDYGIDSTVPVFIVGMPRSGTTLVEQIASSHPKAHGAGELQIITNFEKTLAFQNKAPSTYPECMQSMTSSQFHELAANCLQVLRN